MLLAFRVVETQTPRAGGEDPGPRAVWGRGRGQPCSTAAWNPSGMLHTAPPCPRSWDFCLLILAIS